MPESISFHSRAAGSLGEKEDWYRLIIHDDGRREIEHEWSHTNVYRSGQSNEGTEHIATAEFLNGNHDQTAQRKLRELLAQRGEDLLREAKMPKGPRGEKHR